MKPGYDDYAPVEEILSFTGPVAGPVVVYRSQIRTVNRPILFDFLQGTSFVRRNVVCLVTLNFILWIVFRRMMRISLVVKVLRMDLHDRAADVASFGVPGHMIANFKLLPHNNCFHKIKQTALSVAIRIVQYRESGHYCKASFQTYTYTS